MRGLLLIVMMAMAATETPTITITRTSAGVVTVAYDGFFANATLPAAPAGVVPETEADDAQSYTVIVLIGVVILAIVAVCACGVRLDSDGTKTTVKLDRLSGGQLRIPGNPPVRFTQLKEAKPIANV